MYKGITTSKSSALSVNTQLIFEMQTPLIFEMQLINGALFLKEIHLIRFTVSLTAAVLAAVLAVFIYPAELPYGKYYHFCNAYPKNSVILTLPSISRGSLFGSVKPHFNR